jgi:hypothetical protein
MTDYFAAMPKGKVVLWCYLIWYLVTVFFYFDPAIEIWINSLGISLIIGCALVLSVSSSADIKLDQWQRFRLFLTPFCVSSFSALIKGQGFLFVVPPKLSEQIVLAGACVVFVLFVCVIKYTRKAPTE